MYRYHRYITKHLVRSTLLIALSLTSIVWLTQALRFIDFMVNQGVPLSVFLTLTTLLVPSLLQMILPPALFCAILFVYNRLAMDNELVVLQAAGVSRWRLAMPALHVAAVVTLFCYAMALYLQPASYRQFRDMQSFLRNHYVSILLQEGVFSNPVEGLTVFIRERDRNNVLYGLLVHDGRNPSAPVTMMAQEGRLVQTAQGPRFLLKNGNRQEFRSGRPSFLHFDHYTLDISLYERTSKTRSTDPQELSVSQLFTDDDQVSAVDNQRRRAEGHQRLIWPLYPVVLALIASAALLAGDFNRRGYWRRLVVAVLVGALVLFAAVGLRGLMATRPEMTLAAYLNLCIPALLAAWVIGYEARRQKVAVEAAL